MMPTGRTDLRRIKTWVSRAAAAEKTRDVFD
jgi:hypothetical protein